MNLDAIIARGPRAIPERKNKVTTNEVRRLICRANDNNINMNLISRTFNVEKYMVTRILKKYAETGETDKSPQGGIKPKKLTPEMIEEIREKIDEDCSITSGELVIFVRRQFNLNVCLSTIDRAIGSFNYSMKRITHRALAGDTPQNEQARLDLTTS